jgi:hypothetical protein
MKRHLLAVRVGDIQHLKDVGVELVLRQQLEDHQVVVGCRIDAGHLTRSVGAVEGVFDLVGGQAERGGAVAVDIDDHLGVGNLQIAIDIV